VTLGVVVPCYRQERFLARTVAALERALEGRAWRGALVRSAPSAETLPALGGHWTVVAPAVERPLTPGAARNLGGAACGGEWVLFVDADVEVERAWLDRALALAEREPALGGLWGPIEEWFAAGGREWRNRADLYGVGYRTRAVDYLATLALYRRAALEATGGYDPRLSSDEDYELGLRFQARGLELRSLDALSSRHWSAPRPSFAELGRRWRTGLCFGQGQVLRLYFGRPGFGRLVRRQALFLGALAVWVLGLAALAWGLARGSWAPLLAWLTLPLGALAIMTARKRRVALALHSLVSWSLIGAGMIVGFFSVPPDARAAAAPDRSSAGGPAGPRTRVGEAR